MARRPAARRRRRHETPTDPSTPWLTRLTLGDKLQRLALLAPDALRALEVLIDETLRLHWPGGPPAMD
jgi:hypothetical protein